VKRVFVFMRPQCWVLLPCAHLFICDKAVVRDTINEQEYRAL
jgi:hypothetical protein